MEPRKKLWNEKNDIYETLDSSSLTHNKSDAISIFVTTLPYGFNGNILNLFNLNRTSCIFLQILNERNEVVIPNSYIPNLLEKEIVKTRNKLLES